jgi:hypothetical protein
MKIVITIIGVILILLLFGTMLGGINEAQTDERTDGFAAVVTGGGITTAPVVLVADLYDNDILNVVDITSDLITDVPLVGTYVPGTNTLNVVGLTAADTRTLTVTYEIDALTGSPGVGSFFNFLPLLVVIALVIIVVAAMIAAFKSR